LAFLGAGQDVATADLKPEWIERLLERFDRLEARLDQLLRQQTAKDWYTTGEVAEILGKARFTVREWCRHGRVHCRKRNSGRGKHLEWVIAHEELLRIQREGLLPLRKTSSTIT
jgi:hypothetical protein